MPWSSAAERLAGTVEEEETGAAMEEVEAVGCSVVGVCTGFTQVVTLVFVL